MEIHAIRESVEVHFAVLQSVVLVLTMHYVAFMSHMEMVASAFFEVYIDIELKVV